MSRNLIESFRPGLLVSACKNHSNEEKISKSRLFTMESIVRARDSIRMVIPVSFYRSSSSFLHNLAKQIKCPTPALEGRAAQTHSKVIRKRDKFLKQ